VEREIDALLRSVGVTREATGVTFAVAGVDPILPSAAKIGLIGAASNGLYAALVAAIWRQRTGVGQTIGLDRRRLIHSVSPFFERPWVTINGFPPPSLDPNSGVTMRFVATGDGRHVMPLNAYPRIRDTMVEVLDCRNTVGEVDRAALKWTALDLEAAVQAAGAACVMVRTPDEWAAEEHNRYVGQQPLIQLERIGDGPVIPLPPTPRPLSEVKVLAYAHVLAGAHAGSLLAEHGADVLNLWEPGSIELETTYAMANKGMRSALLDTRSADGRMVLARLLDDADVVVTNHRETRIRSAGLTAEQCAAAKPGIIHLSISCFGHEGPWASWVGFDPHALAVTGWSVLEGSLSEPKLPATLVLNDFVSGALGAAGVAAALYRRSIEGGSWRVRINLTRSSVWFRSLGLVDPAGAGVDADHQPLAPTTAQAETPLGRYGYLPTQVAFSATRPRFEDPVLIPRGSGRPEWRS
jgi:crotonobetainyl-CoA:carnitine CoA-transferase CaiB-like acyl-CoA transferase